MTDNTSNVSTNIFSCINLTTMFYATLRDREREKQATKILRSGLHKDPKL